MPLRILRPFRKSKKDNKRLKLTCAVNAAVVLSVQPKNTTGMIINSPRNLPSWFSPQQFPFVHFSQPSAIRFSISVPLNFPPDPRDRSYALPSGISIELRISSFLILIHIRLLKSYITCFESQTRKHSEDSFRKCNNAIRLKYKVLTSC